jgi:hypothetical protein
VNSEREILLETAASTKEALIGTWKNAGSFVDKNKMLSGGILADSIGTTSLLLLLVAFVNEPTVFSADDISESKEIIEHSLNKIWNTVEEHGYIADPLLDAEESAQIFTKDVGYTDTITWVLSICVLAHFAEKQGMLSFDDATNNIILETTADTLKKILDSQRDDGTWGFASDTNSEKSLYFTYSVGSAIADVYDYIFGELFDDAEGATDVEFVKALDKKMKIDLKQALDNSRKKLAQWLIESCLPLLPVLSGCWNLTPSDLNTLGVWAQTMPAERYEGRNYYNLYYVYYLIDLMITSAADQYYLDVSEDEAAFRALKKLYKDSGAFSQEEYRFFFADNSSNGKEFCNSYLEQAIHASRNHFLNARRTGNDFWETPDSELTVEWKSTDSDLTDTVKGTLRRAKADITEPALVPMALRANINYCYYLSEQIDVTVKNLFDLIKEDRSSKDTNKCVKDLWDDIDYNLSITERSIEALVDYYDYLRKFDNVTESTVAAPQEQATAIESSEIERAIEKVVANYLISDEAIALINERLGIDESIAPKTAGVKATATTTAATGDDSANIIFDLLQRVHGLNASFEATLSADHLCQLFDQLHEYSIKVKIGQGILDRLDAPESDVVNEITDKIYAAYHRTSDELLKRIFNDIENDKTVDFIDMYTAVLRQTKQ